MNKDLQNIFLQNYNYIYSVCYKFLKNREDSCDAVQDIYLKLVKSNSFKGTNNSTFLTYIYATSKNHCLNSLGNRKTNIELFDIEYIEDIDETVNLKIKLIDSLSDADKNLLIYKYIDNKKIKEISLMYNLNNSAVKMKLKRLKQKIKLKYLKELNGISNSIKH